MVPRQLPALGTLYQLAKLQGEGLGSAYEYLVKLRLLDSWLDRDRIRSVVIMGLPERYGSSLEVIWWLQRATVTVVEQDSRKLSRLTEAAAMAARSGFQIRMPTLSRSCTGMHELGMSNEVLQSVQDTRRWAGTLCSHAARIAVFAPNKGNRAHARTTRLHGMTAAELEELFPGARTGYCDSPPFPPGSSAKGRDLSWMIPALSAWSHCDAMLSRRSRSHLVYCLR